jgi:hypothetical protein
MILAIYTLLHVAISLIGIVSGLWMVFGWIAGRRPEGWTKVFLVTTILTGVTGFFFPFHGITPALIVGVLSLLILVLAYYARGHTSRVWQKTYALGCVTALYLNVFVLVVQLFLKIPALKAVAPKQTDPPFVITQSLVLFAFIVLGVLTTLRFHADEPSLVETKIQNP